VTVPARTCAEAWKAFAGGNPPRGFRDAFEAGWTAALLSQAPTPELDFTSARVWKGSVLTPERSVGHVYVRNI
jgi:hypothetical protein